jgi:hypothetical protein
MKRPARDRSDPFDYFSKVSNEQSATPDSNRTPPTKFVEDEDAAIMLAGRGFREEAVTYSAEAE